MHGIYIGKQNDLNNMDTENEENNLQDEEYDEE